MKSETEANRALERYGDMVRRICFLHLKTPADAEDVFQDVFLKYLLRDADFASDAHEKAWLIRVCVNACKDVLKSFFRKRVVPLDTLTAEPQHFDQSDRETLDAVLRLPEKYRNVIYLHYFEGYSAVEIASILKKKENTVYTWLDRARKALRESLGGERVE